MTVNYEQKFVESSTFCTRHHQPILMISHPDFSEACMKCLRDTFLKTCNQENGQEFLKT